MNVLSLNAMPANAIPACMRTNNLSVLPPAK